MDDAMRQEALREELKKKTKGKTTVTAAYRMKYPASVEREYTRIVNEYMNSEKEVLQKYIPELKRILNEGTEEFNSDSAKDNAKERTLARSKRFGSTAAALEKLFDEIAKEVDYSYGINRMREKLRKVASLEQKLSVSEWKKMVHRTFGIDLLDDYYSGEFYEKMLSEWVSENVDLIKTVEEESLSSIKEMVYKNYISGQTTTELVKGIQNQYGMSKRHARLIARDQTAKLNSQITKSQQKDAGITRYKWSTSKDRRVRKSHADLDGKIFSWDDPPETDDGRRCNPGEDYQCRCCAIPVIDIDSLNLPT